LKNYFQVANIDEIPEHQGIKVQIKNKSIALFKYKNKIYAIQNLCPHQNADLADGFVKDGKVFCPMHNWSFFLSDGMYSINNQMKLKTYRVQQRNGKIFINLKDI
jgi:NAD(P)H-dependent nitrite reductase small subunit